jgi:biopolymer transport protein TolQ
VLVPALTPSLLAEIDVLHLMFGGHGAVLVVAYILTAAFILSLFVIFYKLVAISQAQSQSISFLDKFWESKRLDDIFRVAEGLKYSPLAAMFRAGYIELSKVKKGQASDTGSMHEKMDGIENIERALTRAKVSETTKLENLLPFLATVGSAAPFVGLFGTVWGIMDAFTKIAASGKADLATVSGPIAEALIATAVSLAAAIPAVVAYNYFNRRIKVLSAEMTTFGSDYLNIVKRHFF